MWAENAASTNCISKSLIIMYILINYTFNCRTLVEFKMAHMVLVKKRSQQTISGIAATGTITDCYKFKYYTGYTRLKFDYIRRRKKCSFENTNGIICYEIFSSLQ